MRKAVEDVAGRPGPDGPGRMPNWSDPGDVSLAISLIVQLRTVRMADPAAAEAGITAADRWGVSHLKDPGRPLILGGVGVIE